MNVRARSEGEVGVAPGVVADEVAGGDDPADEFRGGVGVAAEEEESGADFVGGEQFEQMRGPDGIGAVIEGKGQLAGPERGDEGGAEELRVGAERRIGAAARRQAYARPQRPGRQRHSRSDANVAMPPVWCGEGATSKHCRAARTCRMRAYTSVVRAAS